MWEMVCYDEWNINYIPIHRNIQNSCRNSKIIRLKILGTHVHNSCLLYIQWLYTCMTT